ncbi:MAG TPA: hypothetical protein ENJ09_14815 [Planctomycetes bacterium]|nr:hypothetical protein [Planctomycetota bacterium]
MASSIQSPRRISSPRGAAEPRLAFAPGLSGLGAFGLDAADALFGDRPIDGEARLGGDARSEVGERSRFPLPGTPHVPGGPPVGRPRGAGTGWCVIERWRAAALRPLLAARFSTPRSASLAERRWNLLCHLRGEGVGTPEPLCVGARGAGLVSRDSFLVTRELTGFKSLPEWLAEQRSSADRRLGLESLRAAVGKLLLAGVWLPRLEPAHLAVSPMSSDCHEAASLGAGGPRVRRLPSIVLVELPGARLSGALPAPRLAEMLGRLDAPELELSRRERLWLLSGALAVLPAPLRSEVRGLVARS